MAMCRTRPQVTALIGRELARNSQIDSVALTPSFACMREMCMNTGYFCILEIAPLHSSCYACTITTKQRALSPCEEKPKDKSKKISQQGPGTRFWVVRRVKGWRQRGRTPVV